MLRRSKAMPPTARAFPKASDRDIKVAFRWQPAIVLYARQHLVEVIGMIPVAIRAIDEDLKALLGKLSGLGDRGVSPQPDCGCDFLAFRTVHDKGHGKPVPDGWPCG